MSPLQTAKSIRNRHLLKAAIYGVIGIAFFLVGLLVVHPMGAKGDIYAIFDIAGMIVAFFNFMVHCVRAEVAHDALRDLEVSA